MTIVNKSFYQVEIITSIFGPLQLYVIFVTLDCIYVSLWGQGQAYLSLRCQHLEKTQNIEAVSECLMDEWASEWLILKQILDLTLS